MRARRQQFKPKAWQLRDTCSAGNGRRRERVGIERALRLLGQALESVGQALMGQAAATTGHAGGLFNKFSA